MSSLDLRESCLPARIDAMRKERLNRSAGQREAMVAGETGGGQVTKVTATFLRAVFGKAVGEGRYAVIFTLPGASSKGFKDVAAAERYAANLAERCDVYVGAGLYRYPRRGGVKDVSALVGLWADIDLAGAAHKKTNLPKDENDARKILNRLPYWPSIIVHSGHGLQVWWLFQKPLTIETEAERRVAMALAKGWTNHIRREAWEAGGWDVDATGDLARVLRLPGTMNRKRCPAVPVRVLEPEGLDGKLVRYKPEDFRQFIGAVAQEPAKKVEVGPLRLDRNAKPPGDKFAALLANDTKFKDTWERNRPDLQDQSPSAFDMSLASIAATDGWEDQAIVNLLIAARRTYGDNLKLRRDYYQRTVARARAGHVDARPESGKRAAETVARRCRHSTSQADSRSGGEKGGMDYKEALRIGRARAKEAAEVMRRWTGVRAYALCAVKPASEGRCWRPVGRQSWKEIARDDSFRGGGRYHLLIVDEDSMAKACSKDRFPLGEVLRLADRLPLRVAMLGDGQLSRRLEEEDLRVNARDHALHVEV